MSAVGQTGLPPCIHCGETEGASPTSIAARDRACPNGGTCAYCACQKCWPDGIAAGDDRVTCCLPGAAGSPDTPTRVDNDE